MHDKHTTPRRSRFLSFCRALAPGLLALPLAAAAADAYPSKPIHIIVSYAPGGPVDVAARVLQQPLAQELGQPVIIENRSGANATIGTAYVARSAPDGYTLLLAAPAHTANPSLMKEPGYDPIKDFAPIAMVMDQPLFVVVPSSLPAHDIKELVAMLKAAPDKYNYGTSGAGGPQHLMGEMFKTATGTKITHVPYRGAAPAAVALLSGETQVSFGTPTNTFPQVKAGKLRALAVSTRKRSHFGPDVPTMAELGYKGFDYTSWTGLLAPAGTPPAIVERLHAAVVKALALKDVQQKFDLQGMDGAGSTPQEFDKFLRLDVERSSKIIKDTGIQPE
jgi:tripartite-type tricarboxylate transporter receptor subunit TctC